MVVTAIFPFENLLIPSVTANRTYRKLAGHREQIPDTDTIVLSMAIVYFAMTTSRHAAVFVVESIFNFAVCIPTVVSITASIKVGEPLCSAIAEAVWSAENAANADLPEVCIINFKFIVNAAVNINAIEVMELSLHIVKTPAYV